MNLWWYDDVMPEFLVSYQDSHLKTAANTLNKWGHLWGTTFAAMTAAGFFFYFVYGTRQRTGMADYKVNSAYAFIERHDRERPVAKRHFLNFGKGGMP